METLAVLDIVERAKGIKMYRTILLLPTKNTLWTVLFCNAWKIFQYKRCADCNGVFAYEACDSLKDIPCRSGRIKDIWVRFGRNILLDRYNLSLSIQPEDINRHEHIIHPEAVEVIYRKYEEHGLIRLHTLPITKTKLPCRGGRRILN